MVTTMREYQGVGLAAVQVHESRQVAVIEVAPPPKQTFTGGRWGPMYPISTSLERGSK